jgi:hypothetical protein
MYQPSGLPASRKDTILILTIIGWVACGIACFFSYAMAKADMEAIDAGQMDGRDRDTLNILKIVSLVNIGFTCLGILFAICYVCFIIFYVGAMATQSGAY